MITSDSGGFRATSACGAGIYYPIGGPSEKNRHGQGAQRLNTGNDGSDLSPAPAPRPVGGLEEQDAASNNAIIAEDFNSFWPDGSRHIGRPTPQQMAEQAHYSVQALRVAGRAGWSGCGPRHLLADVTTPGDNLFQMAVGEVWVKRNGQWLIRSYSGTVIK